MNSVSIEGKTFDLYLSRDQINNLVNDIAISINQYAADLAEPVILISILDGSFMFMSDLVRKLDFQHKIEFVKLKSYDGLTSTKTVQYLLELDTDIEGKHIIIVEDIIDTGLTIESFVAKIRSKNPLSLKIAALFSKPEVHNDIINIDFLGQEIPPLFIVGYGLDLNGFGRNLPEIYNLRI